MKRIICVLSGLLLVLGMVSNVWAAGEKLLFSFEKDTESWEIPDWALEKEDHVADSISVSSALASEGKSSLEVKADFPGAKWTGAYVETVEYFDWTAYGTISVDIYLPADAPMGLKGKIILTVGENWEWTEMSKQKALEPGKWTTITANLKLGTTDWKRAAVDDAFRKDVRKLGVRVESNMKPANKGSFYIDNIRLSE